MDLYGAELDITVMTWANTFGPMSFIIGDGIEQYGPLNTDTKYDFPYTVDAGRNYLSIIPTYGYGLGEGTLWSFKFPDRILDTVNVNTNFGGFTLNDITFPNDSEMVIRYSNPVTYQPTGSYLTFEIGVLPSVPEPSQMVMMSSALILAGIMAKVRNGSLWHNKT